MNDPLEISQIQPQPKLCSYRPLSIHPSHFLLYPPVIWGNMNHCSKPKLWGIASSNFCSTLMPKIWDLAPLRVAYKCQHSASEQ